MRQLAKLLINSVVFLVIALGCTANRDEQELHDDVTTDVTSQVDAAEVTPDSDDNANSDVTPDTISGDECSWNTSGPACNPMSPRQLFDIEAIKALSLSDLKWQPTQTQLYQGVTVQKGTFNPGTWDAYTSEGEPKTIELHYVAALYIPEGWPRVGDPTVGYLASVHYEANLLQPVAAQIAKNLRIPVLHIGQLPRDPRELGFGSRGELNQASYGLVLKNNRCKPGDMKRGYFALAMAQADMHGITLLQRLAEKEGGSVDKVAFRGFSKEGVAGWLASVVDPRIEVAALGGFQNQDSIESAQIRTASWGCYGDPEDADPSGPQTAGIWLDWLLNTPAGAAYLNLYDVQTNKHLLYPRFFIIDGDVGKLGLHDDLYALGVETPFLDNFTEKPWRYVRKAGKHKGAGDDDGDTVSKAKVPLLLVENLLGGPNSEQTTYPRVIDKSALLEGNLLQVTARGSDPTETMVLYWSWSTDRNWKDPEQAPWVDVQMTKGNDGVWTAPQIKVPAGMVIGWYVEARNVVKIGAGTETRTDAGSIHFLRQSAPIVCNPQIPNWCAL